MTTDAKLWVDLQDDAVDVYMSTDMWAWAPYHSERCTRCAKTLFRDRNMDFPTISGQGIHCRECQGVTHDG